LVVFPVLVDVTERVTVGVLVSVPLPVWDELTTVVLVATAVAPLGVDEVLVTATVNLSVRVLVPVLVSVMVEVTTVWDCVWVAVPADTKSNL
jgi:hypothetical protein